MSAQAKSESHAPTASHTPGPWTVHAEGLRGGRYWVVVIADSFDSIDIHEDENGEANARLIAAAPDMLAALKEVEMLGIPWGGRVREQVRAAIAKAEGRAS